MPGGWGSGWVLESAQVVGSAGGVGGTKQYQGGDGNRCWSVPCMSGIGGNMRSHTAIYSLVCLLQL